jgi:hypothetical protein
VKQLKRANHFVPQVYLRRWSENGTHVWAHPLLVSHENVLPWSPRAMRGLAFRTDLYTLVRAGVETDEMETWLDREFETPAEEALRKVEQDAPLGRRDWERLAYFAAAQNLRTPAAYLEHKQRMEATARDLINRGLKKSVAKLERGGEQGQSLRVLAWSQHLAPEPLVPLRVYTEPDPDGERVRVHAEFTIGRQSWLASMRHLLSSTARVLSRHSWSIMYPDTGTEWFTSDHPLIRLNYYARGRYDFRGGWGNPGSEILLPLSPRHLMYTQVGKCHPARITLSVEQTLDVQKMIAEHAHRWIFARKRIGRVTWFRQRRVDAAAYQAEKEEWRRWSREQAAAEREHGYDLSTSAACGVEAQKVV